MEKLLQILKKTHKDTGGHCGQTFISLLRKSGYKSEELKLILKQLYKDGRITVHDGAFGKLIMIKP